MATIKTIAEKANVSPSTVSIILNGKTKERKISPETEKKVLQIVAELGYKPNVQAINLRTARKIFDYRIIIFWIADSRAETMIRFFKSVESEIMENNYSCEILLKPYKLGNLKNAMTDDLILSCHGIIICNSSETDLEFLENTVFPRPIVLYNRYSKKYSTVTMDDKKIGTIPADTFFAHKKKRPAIITSEPTFNGMLMRTNLFTYTCTEYGMKLPILYQAANTQRGGYETTLKLLKETPDIDCIFYTGDTLALGALRAFYEQNISVPDKIEFISVGNNVLDQCEICCPSISVVYLPIENVAAQCFHLLYRLMSYQENGVQSIVLPVTYIARESCPR